MTFLAVWLERGLKRETIDGASIAVIPRDGSFALAFFGSMRKAPDSAFSLSAGRKSFALKRIEVLVTSIGITD